MDIAGSILLFAVMGAVFVGAALGVGRWLRPSAPTAAKADPYECGEESVGSPWVRFDLRFYAVALLYLVFDVEIAFFYPWAVAYGSATGADSFEFRAAALVGMMIFFGVLLVGFAYLWRFGYLDWTSSRDSVKNG